MNAFLLQLLKPFIDTILFPVVDKYVNQTLVPGLIAKLPSDIQSVVQAAAAEYEPSLEKYLQALVDAELAKLA